MTPRLVRRRHTRVAAPPCFLPMIGDTTLFNIGSIRLRYLPAAALRPARIAIACALAAIALTPSNAAWIEAKPPVRIIVPSAPGGGADFLARVLADKIGAAEDVKIVVENRPGAGNTIGTELAARAAPDGNTLLINTPEFVINAHLRKLSYDPLIDFAPICYLVRSPQLIVVRPDSPYHTLADFVASARGKPGELTLGSAGPGSAAHIAFESFKQSANVQITFVPYPGTTPAVNAVLGGYVAAAIGSYPNVAELVRTGKLRALAVTSTEHVDQMPEIPTTAESGFKNFVADIWFGVVAPAKTPAAVLAEREAWFTAALKEPSTKSQLSVQGLFSVSMCGSDFGTFIHEQFDSYGRAIRQGKISIQ